MVLIYRTVAVLVFLLLLRQSTRHLMGSLILSIIWPALVPLMGYWAVKRYAFGFPPSKRYFELELLGGLLVGCMGVILWGLHAHLLPV